MIMTQPYAPGETPSTSLLNGHIVSNKILPRGGPSLPECDTGFCLLCKL